MKKYGRLQNQEMKRAQGSSRIPENMTLFMTQPVFRCRMVRSHLYSYVARIPYEYRFKSITGQHYTKWWESFSKNEAYSPTRRAWSAVGGVDVDDVKTSRSKSLDKGLRISFL